MLTKERKKLKETALKRSLKAYSDEVDQARAKKGRISAAMKAKIYDNAINAYLNEAIIIDAEKPKLTYRYAKLVDRKINQLMKDKNITLEEACKELQIGAIYYISVKNIIEEREVKKVS